MVARRTVVLAAALLAAMFAAHAHADVFTWVDSHGRVNVSNLPPPEDVARKVKVDVTRAQPRDEARDREVLALAERVRSLEDELRAAAAAPAVPPPPPPPVAVVQVPQYVPVQVPVPVPSYMPVEADAAPPCNAGWAGCYGAWGYGAWPTIVVTQGVARRHHPPRAGHVPFVRTPVDFTRLVRPLRP